MSDDKNQKKKNTSPRRPGLGRTPGLGRGLSGMFSAAKMQAPPEEPAAAKDTGQAPGTKQGLGSAKLPPVGQGPALGDQGQDLGSLQAPVSSQTSSQTSSAAELAIRRDDGERVQEIEIDCISPFADQPRKAFAEDKLKELAASIQANGVIQPILVTPTAQEGEYRLVAGERRWRAARLAGLTRIPALVRNLTRDQHLEQALVENIQREDLNPIEEAQAYQLLLEQNDLTQDDLAKKIGKSRSAIANGLRLLQLPEGVQKKMASGDLSVGHAKVLLSLEDQADQEHLCEEVLNKQWSVRHLEEVVGALKEKNQGKTEETNLNQEEDSSGQKADQLGPNLLTGNDRQNARKILTSLEIEKIQDELAFHVGAPVAIHDGGSGKGRLEILYSSQEVLDDILEKLRRL